MIEKVGLKKKYSLLPRLGFLALSVYILYKIVDFKLVFQHIREIPVSILCVLIFIALVRTWLTGLRWKMVNPDVSGQLSNWQYFRLLMAAKPFNLIMPGALGGDFARAAFTIKAIKAKRVDNVIAIVVDRFVGLLSITILGATALVFMSDLPDKRPFYSCFALLVLAFAVGLLFGGNPWFLKQVEIFCTRLGQLGKRLLHVVVTWGEALRFFRRNFHLILTALLLCLPIHGLSFATTYIIALSLGIDVSIFDISVVLSLVWVITAVPITISGAGVRELSMIYFLALFGVQAESATAMSIFIYIISISLGLIGVVFAFLPDSSLKKVRRCKKLND